MTREEEVQLLTHISAVPALMQAYSLGKTHGIKVGEKRSIEPRVFETAGTADEEGVVSSTREETIRALHDSVYKCKHAPGRTCELGEVIGRAIDAGIELGRAESVSAWLRDRRSLCVECGPDVAVDDEGLCATCGGQAIGEWLRGSAANLHAFALGKESGAAEERRLVVEYLRLRDKNRRCRSSCDRISANWIERGQHRYSELDPSPTAPSPSPSGSWSGPG